MPQQNDNRNLPSLEGAKSWACGNLVERPASTHSSCSFWKGVTLAGSTHKLGGVRFSVTPG